MLTLLRLGASFTTQANYHFSEFSSLEAPI